MLLLHKYILNDDVPSPKPIQKPSTTDQTINAQLGAFPDEKLT